MMKETTPLIRREDLAAEGTHHHGVPRRRSQHVVGVRNDHDWEDLPSSYAPSLQEFDKEDRRLSRRIGDCYLSLLWRIRDAFAKISLKQDPMQDYEGYYLDNYNDQPWHCSFGTAEVNGIWMNRKDQAGTIMSLLVWLLISEYLMPSGQYKRQLIINTHISRNNGESVNDSHTAILVRNSQQYIYSLLRSYCDAFGRTQSLAKYRCHHLLYHLCIGTGKSCENYVYRSWSCPTIGCSITSRTTFKHCDNAHHVLTLSILQATYFASL